MKTPMSRIMFGHARENIDQPIGIFHPMWGAATHSRATGKHNDLFLDVIAMASVDEIPFPGSSAKTTYPPNTTIRVQLDTVGLIKQDEERLTRAVHESTKIPPERIVISSSHTHATALFMPDRYNQPGGELIADYLDFLENKVRQASSQAVKDMQEAWITYGQGRCSLAVNRDYWDDRYGGYVCGYNPDGQADDTVIVGRVTDLDGKPIVTVVNYACHPTTLAWENTLISSDYVGSMRDIVTRETGVPTIFLLGACGDLAPRRGYVKDTKIADQNGRELGFSVLATLQSMGPVGYEFSYDGPVVSGATLGTWSYKPVTNDRLNQIAQFGWISEFINLPIKSLQSKGELIQDMATWKTRQEEAEARGDTVTARDCGAHVERAKRWLSKLDDLYSDPTSATNNEYPLRITVCRTGDAVWVTCGGEPYSVLQEELRRRFPDMTVLVSGVCGDWVAGYLLPENLYGQGLYQEEPSPLSPGCLERVIDFAVKLISNLLERKDNFQ